MALLLVAGAFVGSLANSLVNPPAATAQAGQTTGRIRTMVWNTETLVHLPSEMIGGGRKDLWCHPNLLKYRIDKSVFIAQYAKQEQLDIMSLQELQAVCMRARVTTDAKGRTVPDFSNTGASGYVDGEGTKRVMEEFKRWFKDNYNYNGNMGRTMTDAQFEQELTRVMGRQTYEDVWVRFLPFDETFWAAANLLFTQQYPMQASTKTFEEDTTQWFRVAVFSRFPYYKQPNFTSNGSSDNHANREVFPLPHLDDDEESDEINSDTRWGVIAPLDTMFGNLSAMAIHTRSTEAVVGSRRIFSQANERWDVDDAGGPLYMIGGDFNTDIRGGDNFNVNDTYSMEPETGIDYWALPRSRLPRLNFVPGSVKILVANGGGRQEGVPPSDHNGVIVDLEGPIVKPRPPLTEITLPDYMPGSDESGDRPQQPPIAAPNVGQCMPRAEAAGNTNLAAEIDEFFAAGAQGYLVWQYSGDRGFGEEFASDPYAFFRNQPSGLEVCSILKQKADANPGKFVGVNMWDAGDGKHSEAKLVDHFSWLKNTCGVTVVRTFAKAGGADGVRKLVSAASQAGVKIMPAIGDYSNGGGGIPSGVGSDFFTTGYTGEYQSLAQGVVGASAGHAGLFGYELANEVHCRGDANALTAYTNWGKAIGAILRSGSPNVGYGQKASENTTLCDSPGGPTAPNGQSHFTFSNAIPEISMTSGHYYNPAEKALALQALTQSQALGKMYYVGEAPAQLNGSPGENICPVSLDDYYITPIKGVGEGGVEGLNTIRDDLISQGYRAACLGRGFSVDATAQGIEAMGILFDQPLPHNNSAILGGQGMGRDRAYLTPVIYSVLNTDYRDVLYPLYRDVDGPGRELKQSLEAYFSNKVLSSGEYYSNIEINSAAINSLVTNPQRCGLSYLNLLSRDAMCRKLASPEACALYATKIPGTSYDAQSLLEDFETYYSQLTEKNNGESVSITTACQQLMGSKDSSIESLKMAMRNAPLEMEEAYRLAFAVTTIRLRLPNPITYTNLFTHPLGGWLGPPKPKHGVLVTAFKIPDILTNKGAIDDGLMAARTEEGVPNYLTTLRQGTSGNTSYLDPAVLTRNSLIPNDAAYVYERQQRCQRQVFQAAARRVSTLVQDDVWAEIECLGGGAGVSGVGSPQCKDPMSKALIDMINTQSLLEPITAGTGDYCSLDPEAIANQVVAATGGTPSLSDIDGPRLDSGNLTPEQEDYLKDLVDEDIQDDGDYVCFNQSETSEYINDPANLQPLNSSGHVFTPEWGAAFLEQLFAGDDCTHGGAGNGDPSYASTQRGGDCEGEDWHLKSKFYVTPTENAPGGGIPLGVKQFIVYPVGYDLRTVESVLAGSFFSSTQLSALMREALAYDHVELEGEKVDFNGGADSFSFTEARRPPQQTTCEEIERQRPLPGGGTETYYDYKCPTYTMTFALQQLSANKPNAIIGARLGYWMRSVQRSLVATSMKTWEYLKTCRSTQEFLLDICGGEPRVNPGDPDKPSPSLPPVCKVPEGSSFPEIKAMTFNTLEGMNNYRSTRIAQYVNSANIDIIALQESGRFDELTDKLNGDYSVVESGYLGGKRLGIVSRFPLSDKTERMYGDRAILSAIADVPNADGTTTKIRIFVVHPTDFVIYQSTHWEFIDETIRTDAEKIDAAGEKYGVLPHIVLGDFNSNSVNLTNGSPRATNDYYRGCLTEGTPNCSRTSMVTSPDPEEMRSGTPIDHIIVSKAMGKHAALLLGDYRVLSPFLDSSLPFPEDKGELDHWPVAATIQVAPAAACEVPDSPSNPGQCVSTPADLERMKYNSTSTLPDTGVATYYEAGVMNRTLGLRLNGVAGNGMKNSDVIRNCELLPGQMNYTDANPNPTLEDGTKFIGCVALNRLGDLTYNASGDKNDIRRVWIKNEGSSEAPIGPFAVIDVAAAKDAACLHDGKIHGRHWVVDMNFQAFAHLFGQTGGPDAATVCDSQTSCP